MQPANGGGHRAGLGEPVPTTAGAGTIRRSCRPHKRVAPRFSRSCVVTACRVSCSALLATTEGGGEGCLGLELTAGACGR